jgi:hypothetical protein
VALLRAKASASKLQSDNEDVRAGIDVVVKALESPIRQIAENAGVEGSIVVGRVTDPKSHNFGVDAQSEKYVDMMEAGIIDPARAVLRALQDAGRRHGRHGLLICFNPDLREEGPEAIQGLFYERGLMRGSKSRIPLDSIDEDAR